MTRQDRQTGNDDERAVSPVIGVILMVAITVILAAVIAAFVLDLGDTSANPQATFEIEEDQNDTITITITNIDRLDNSTWRNVDKDKNGTVGDSVGDSTELDADDTGDDDYDPGDTIQIIGVYEGQESVLRTYEARE